MTIGSGGEPLSLGRFQAKTAEDGQNVVRADVDGAEIPYASNVMLAVD